MYQFGCNQPPCHPELTWHDLSQCGMMTSSNGNNFRVTGHLWRGIHRSPVNSPHKDQWRGALMFSLICVWINGWVNNREAGDLRRYRAHYDVTVMGFVMWWLRTRVAHDFTTIEKAELYDRSVQPRLKFLSYFQLKTFTNVCMNIKLSCTLSTVAQWNIFFNMCVLVLLQHTERCLTFPKSPICKLNVLI